MELEEYSFEYFIRKNEYLTIPDKQLIFLINQFVSTFVL